LTFSNVDGGCSQISISASQGGRHQHFLALMVDAPGSSSSTSREARRRCFLNDSWWALSDPLAAPPRGLPSMFSCVDGWHSWILRQHHHGAPSSMFLSNDGGRSWILQQHLPGGPSSIFLSIDDGRSQILQHHLPRARHRCHAPSGSRSHISGNASQGATTVHTAVMSRTFFLKYFLGPRTVEDPERSITANTIQQKQ
jgi:hypothetical protein